MPFSPPRSRVRRRVHRRALVVAVAAALVAVTATTLGAGPVGAARGPKAVVKIAPGETAVFATGGGPDALPGEVTTGVMAAIDGYLADAAARPLQKGRPGDEARLATVLSPAVMARLAGTDRTVLVDEGLPKATGTVKVTAKPVVLTGLADGSGKVVVVTAGLAATTRTRTTKGPVTITRTGDLVLRPDDGTWKIVGYALTVDRVGKGLGTTDSTAPSTPAAPTPTSVAR